MRKHSIPNFIQKTWEMLEEERNLAIVSWNTAGTSFEIHNEVLFAEDLLPHYFKHSNFASFIRQLNMYNFHKRKTPTGNTEFFHKLFRRDHSELLIGIRRKPSEAEMMEAEQLIQKLAPQCLDHRPLSPAPTNASPAVKLEEADDSQYKMQPQLHYYSPHLWILTPLLTNAYQDYEWKAEKKIKTNIIIQRVGSGDTENVALYYAS